MKKMILYIQCIHENKTGTFVKQGDKLLTEVYDSAADLFNSKEWIKFRIISGTMNQIELK